MPRGPRDSILPHPAVFAATTAAAAVSWSLAAWLWSSGERAFAASLLLAGPSLGPCLTGYATSPRAFKRQQRRVVLFTGGLGILALPSSPRPACTWSAFSPCSSRARWAPRSATPRHGDHAPAAGYFG